jgi:two-component system sensor histidine kinase HydH
MERTSATSRPSSAASPKRAFIVLVLVVCLGLAASAGYDYTRLSDLRIRYLRNTANEIATGIETQTRGAFRFNAGVWQGAFSECLASRGQTVAFLSVFDESGQLIAGAGDRFAPEFTGPTGLVRAEGTELYVLDLQLPRGGAGRGPGAGLGRGPGMGRGGPPGMSPETAPGPRPDRLRIGIYSSSADDIRWQALTHLLMNSLAILVLAVLARYFLRTLRHFLQLKAREESARHLTALGAMAATLAHEIRNPLGAMKGLTQLAQETLPGDHKTQSLMSTVVREAERLEKLVTDLLSFARPREPEISRFDFRRLLGETADVLRPKLEAAGIRVRIESGEKELAVDSDESGLRQVLMNLVLNAMDASPAGGEIRLAARHDEARQLLIAEVIDAGPGLADRSQEELFEPFATTKAKGTGLGLAISRQIAERLGGTLELANRQGGGAICTLALPLRPDAAPRHSN